MQRRRSARRRGCRSPAADRRRCVRAAPTARDRRSRAIESPAQNRSWPARPSARPARLRLRAPRRRRTGSASSLLIRSWSRPESVNSRRWVSATDASAATGAPRRPRRSERPPRAPRPLVPPAGLVQTPVQRRAGRRAGARRRPGRESTRPRQEAGRRPDVAAGGRLHPRGAQALGRPRRRASTPLRPPARARRGSGTHARGGSRRSRRARRDRCRGRRSRRRSARAAPPGSPSGARRRPRRGSADGGSETRPRPGTAPGPGRTSSRRTRAVSGVKSWASLGESACTAPRWNDAPLDRAALEHDPLGRVELVEPRRQQRLDRRRHGNGAVGDSRTSATISSTKSGFPSAASRILARSASSADRAVEQARDERVGVGRRRAARAARSSRSACRRPSSAAGRAAPAVPCRAAGSARRGSGRRRDRRDRGTPPRPSGCRRARRRAAPPAATASSSLRMAQAISSTEETTAAVAEHGVERAGGERVQPELGEALSPGRRRAAASAPRRPAST